MSKLFHLSDGAVVEGCLALDPATGLPVEYKTAADRELSVLRYVVKAAWPGATVGHVIRQTVCLDVSGGVMLPISVMWENESTGETITAPAQISASLEAIKQGDALTLSQLLSAGLATASNQLAQIGYLADVAAGADPLAGYKAQQVDTSTAGMTYVRKASSKAGSGWLIVRIAETATATEMGYAGPRNNPAHPTASAAWAARTSLAFGDVGAA